MFFFKNLFKKYSSEQEAVIKNRRLRLIYNNWYRAIASEKSLDKNNILDVVVEVTESPCSN